MPDLSMITNFLPISEAIATAGQPTEAQFADIQAAGYSTVINLAMPTSDNALPNEQAIVTGLGMTYVHIPVVWEQPTVADCDRFFAVMDQVTQQPDQKVFVHCALNMRVSAFVYLYRRLKLETPEAIAQADLAKIWQPIPTWQAFIDARLID
jgi:protein tyrosine phosphatase (PTP) superfamily phosphohydrolase (DUF442 family)